jgi:hypothetical protein
VREFVGKSLHAAHFGLGAGGRAAVGLGAGVIGGAGTGPFVGPVAVEIDAPAEVGGVGAWEGRDAVLAPESVLGLCVDESW